MPLEKCPHMAARCPHKSDVCDDPNSKSCHHVTSSTNAAATLAATLTMFGTEKLSPAMSGYLCQMNELLLSADMPLEKQDGNANTGSSLKPAF